MTEREQEPALSDELCGNPSCECYPQLGKDYCCEACQKKRNQSGPCLRMRPPGLQRVSRLNRQ